MAGTIAQSVGVDIAKDTFDVHLHPAGRVGRFANGARGRAALIAWLEGFAIAASHSRPPAPITAPSSVAWPRPACRWSRSTHAGPVASPRRAAGMPRPMRSTRRSLARIRGSRHGPEADLSCGRRTRPNGSDAAASSGNPAPRDMAPPWAFLPVMAGGGCASSVGAIGAKCQRRGDLLQSSGAWRH